MLIVLEKTDALPVPLETAKVALNVRHDDDDLFIEQCLRAAVEFVEDHCGVDLVRKTRQLRLNGWPLAEPQRLTLVGASYGTVLCLEIAPVVDVLSVSYVDEDAIEQPIDEANYTWERTDEGADIRFSDSYSLPTLHPTRAATVRVTFTSGYADPSVSESGDDDPSLALPDRAAMAITLLTGHWYEHREAVAANDLKEVMLGAERLLGQLRIFR